MSKNKALDRTMKLPPAIVDRFGFGDFWRSLAVDDMKVEEYRENGTVVVRAELPGVDPDKDIEVTVENGLLHIHAERTQRFEHPDETHYRSEFRYGAFSRTFRLPAGATENDVKASYRDGILEVKVPVDDHKASTQKVPISRS